VAQALSLRTGRWASGHHNHRITSPPPTASLASALHSPAPDHPLQTFMHRHLQQSLVADSLSLGDFSSLGDIRVWQPDGNVRTLPFPAQVGHQGRTSRHDALCMQDSRRPVACQYNRAAACPVRRARSPANHQNILHSPNQPAPHTPPSPKSICDRQIGHAQSATVLSLNSPSPSGAVRRLTPLQ
jgi:hypothetical protein